MNKSISYFYIFLFLNLSTNAYWSPTPISELSEQSSVVVMGKVTELKSILDTRRVFVTLEVIKNFKGTYKKEKLSFEAPFTLTPDVLITPLPKEPRSYFLGETCLVFLKKTDKRYFMTKETDGKFHLDKELKKYKSAVMQDKWKPIADLLNLIK